MEFVSQDLTLAQAVQLPDFSINSYVTQLLIPALRTGRLATVQQLMTSVLAQMPAVPPQHRATARRVLAQLTKVLPQFYLAKGLPSFAVDLWASMGAWRDIRRHRHQILAASREEVDLTVDRLLQSFHQVPQALILLLSRGASRTIRRRVQNQMAPRGG